MRPEHLVPLRLTDDEGGDCAVAEVEHEPRSRVAVVEQVRLPARGDHQHALELGLRPQHVAHDAERHRASVRDVVVLDREGALAAEPVRDPGRGLPDRPVLPHRPEVDDRVDRARVDAGLREQPLRGLHREVADMLVLGRDVLSAQAELVDEHRLRESPTDRRSRQR